MRRSSSLIEPSSLRFIWRDSTAGPALSNLSHRLGLIGGLLNFLIRYDHRILRQIGKIFDRLPWITWNKTEKAPYITAGMVIVKDPEYGRNLGVYRMMYAGRNQTFLRLSPGHHGYEYYKNAEFRKEKKLDVAVVIGADPSIFLASQFVPGIDVDEFGIAGAAAKTGGTGALRDRRHRSSRHGGNCPGRAGGYSRRNR